MLNPRLKEYMSKGYAKVGAISFKLTINLRKGKDHLRTSQELWERGIKLLEIVETLFRFVTFDATTGRPILWRITEAQVNKLVECMIEIGELDNLPIFPSTLPTVKPIVVTSGLQGNPGTPGINGTDANIVVEPAPTEDEVSVDSVVVSGVKHYQIGFNPYMLQQLSGLIQTGKIREIGDSVAFNINLVSTKGTRALQTLVCTSDPVLDGILQPLVSLPALNGLTQPVTIVLSRTGIIIDTTYTFQSYDGRNNVNSQDTINFYYPYLYGATDNPTGFDPYTTLTKLIGPKAARALVLNGTNKYFWVLYPASYGTLSSIKDQNGFEKIADFTTGLINVSSTGLANNWAAVSFRYYRTTLKTSIVNAPFTITF